VKPRRSALPTPRYVVRKPLKSGGGTWGYFFDVPHWARKADCPVRNEPLGQDYEAAVKRAETVLLPAFDSWRSGGATDKAERIAKVDTLDWLFGEFRSDRRFAKLDPGTKRVHETGFRLVGHYVLKDGRRFGQANLKSITTNVVDTLYEALVIVKEADADGNVIERERRTTVNHAMKSCRRAWNIAHRRQPDRVPHVNPFASMGLTSSSRETPTATFEELQAFRAKAKEMGLASLATAALIGWEWLQRQTDIFGTFSVADYRPKDHPDKVYVKHEKTGESNWNPLFSLETGAPLYPELMAELEAIKCERIGGLMLRRDWGDQGPWPTWPTPDDIDLTHMTRKVKEVIRAAGLRDELSFASFRHGGFTEAGDAELSDRQIMALGRHKSPKVLPRYVKRTMRQVAEGAEKRRLARTKAARLSE
jgi:hypothetical protein